MFMAFLTQITIMTFLKADRLILAGRVCAMLSYICYGVVAIWSCYPYENAPNMHPGWGQALLEAL